jgi:hypothetical protein
MKTSIILIFLISTAFANDIKSYQDIFPGYDKTQEIKISDPISDNPVNILMLKILKGSSLLGYVRKINTTTGCNSACLPVTYTSFYDEKGLFKKIKSSAGLTKLNHASFTQEDYSNLELLIVMAPKKLDKVGHPKEMTDAITGATKKSFLDVVVKDAAYSTLRIHLYNQHTQKEISKLNKKSK